MCVRARVSYVTLHNLFVFLIMVMAQSFIECMSVLHFFAPLLSLQPN